jgi:hypothetical protein
MKTEKEDKIFQMMTALMALINIVGQSKKNRNILKFVIFWNKNGSKCFRRSHSFQDSIKIIAE